jgi:arylsulfatase A-like enzyme
LYEGGIRTAGIIRWPGRIAAGSASDAPVISPDYPPTILDAAGIDTPEGLRFDGISVLPQLEHPAEGHLQRPLFWHYPHYGNQGGAPGAAVRVGNWKLIEWFDDGRTELFNLSDDPSEQQNIAAEESQRVASMQMMLRLWQRDVGARATSKNPHYDPAGVDGRAAR